ncbi:hypothetical protein I312_105598 [Cryptococcus bacillisporus CA1280]|uniref:uncharacterized protein n=1 Tax=Cryptococcus bacillisporus CA1280 TaxID=1296109 RepID=UPI00336853C5
MVTTSQPSNKLRKFERAQEGGGSKENCEVSSGGRVMGSEAVLAVVIDKSPGEVSPVLADKCDSKYERW